LPLGAANITKARCNDSRPDAIRGNWERPAIRPTALSRNARRYFRGNLSEQLAKKKHWLLIRLLHESLARKLKHPSGISNAALPNYIAVMPDGGSAVTFSSFSRRISVGFS
jgi:hypothetical protein